MKRLLYFDVFSGAGGDMILGALLDLGLSFAALKRELNKMDIGSYRLRADSAVRAGIAGKKLEVKAGKEVRKRAYPDIERLLVRSRLSEGVRERSRAIFRRLAEAEGRVHGVPTSQVHFHEVGAVDALVDIVGACVGFELLGVEEFYASPINVGRGTVRFRDTVYPVPAPATAELLKGIPTYAGEAAGELTTPTGAAILSTVCTRFAFQPLLVVERIGYGAGTRQEPDHPNMLRVFLARHAEEPLAEGFSAVQMEVNIDDMNPQLFGYLWERAFALGALDLFLAPVQMKKNRPGTLLTLLCKPESVDALATLIFTETTTVGVRYFHVLRKTLQRELVEVRTPWGSVRVKESKLDGRIVNFAPEYEDCKRIAERTGRPLKEVLARANQSYLSSRSRTE